MILAVDPGESNGWALVRFTTNKEFICHRFGTMKVEDFYKWLETKTSFPESEESISLFVVEDWKTRPRNAKQGAFDWDRMIAPQVIGALSFVAVTKEIPIVFQQPAIKPVGYGFLGKKYQKGAKNVHHWDALAHAIYYGVTNRLCVPNKQSVSS